MIDLEHVDLSKIDMTTDELFVKTAKNKKEIKDILSEIKKSKNNDDGKNGKIKRSVAGSSYTGSSFSYYYDMYNTSSTPSAYVWYQSGRSFESLHFNPSTWSASSTTSIMSTESNFYDNNKMYINLLDYFVDYKDTDDDGLNLKNHIRNNKQGIMISDDSLLFDIQQSKYHESKDIENIFDNIKRLSEQFKRKYSLEYVKEVDIEPPEKIINDVRMDKYMGITTKVNNFYTQLFPLGETTRFNDIEFDFKMELAEEKFLMLTTQ